MKPDDQVLFECEEVDTPYILAFQAIMLVKLWRMYVQLRRSDNLHEAETVRHLLQQGVQEYLAERPHLLKGDTQDNGAG